MARTLHLLVCISAAITASGGYINPYSVQSWSPPYNYEDSETMDHPTKYDSMNVRPVRSNAKMMMYEPAKFVNRGPKSVPLWRRARSAEDTREPEIPGILEKKLTYKLYDNVTDYPVELADKLIAELGDKIKYLAKDKLPPKLNKTEQKVVPRVGTIGYQELCASEIMIKYPLGGYDRDDNYWTILNNKKKPIQGVRVEICDETGGPCNPIISAMPEYPTFCTQKYAYRPMLVIDGNKVVIVHISVPSWCACVVSLN